MNADPRVQELLGLAAEEGITLPMHPEFICWLEDRGFCVDLDTGLATRVVLTGTPTPSGKAVAHLLADVAGAIVVT